MCTLQNQKLKTLNWPTAKKRNGLRWQKYRRMIIFLPRLKQKEYDAFGVEVEAKSPGKETLGGGNKPKVDRMAEE